MFVVTPASAKQIVFGTLDQDFKNGFANAGPDDWAPQVAQIKGASSLNITIPWSDPVGRLEADRGEFKYQNLPVRALQLVSKYYKRWLGIEREASYFEIAEARIAHARGECVRRHARERPAVEHEQQRAPRRHALPPSCQAQKRSNSRQ